MVEQTKPDLNKLYGTIVEHGIAKGYLKQDGDALPQYVKLVEEVGELAAGLLKKKPEGIRDALGDVFVLWCNLCYLTGNNPQDTVQEVYDIISKRNGKLIDGVFVKEEDL